MPLKTLEYSIPTTVYHIASKVGKGDSPLLVFIPGNPGIIGYYTEYLESLSSEFPSFEILGISQAGCSTTVALSNQAAEPLYGLRDQVDHKTEIIRQFLQEQGNPKRDVLIFGHSVGCWMLQRIVEATYKEINYKFLGFITPTVVDIHKSEKGSVLYPVVRVFPKFNVLVSKFAYLFQWLPLGLLNYLLNTILPRNTSKYALGNTKSLITNPSIVEQCLGLATEEMNHIQNDWEYQEFFFKNLSNIPKWLFFSTADHWVSNPTRVELISKLSNDANVLITEEDDIKHSFCLHQSEQFADITTKALKTLYQDGI